MDRAAIETHELTRHFGSLAAVDHVSISVRSKTIFGLLGANGAGKTTLMKMLTTLLPPTSGTASVAGYDVVARPREVRRRIGYVPQLISSDGTLTGRENLALSAALCDVPRRECGARIAEALRFMDLTDVGDRLVRTYSGGMIRRLEIAQGLLHGPEVLFLDEPTVGLDPLARQAVWARLEDLCSRVGTTILLTTHDMEEAEALCSEIAILRRGSVSAIGSLAALKSPLGANATLEDVFARHVDAAASAGNYAEIRSARRAAQRRG